MSFLFMERYFNLTAHADCEDVGITAIRDTGGDDNVWMWFVWLSLAFAFGGVESIVATLFREHLHMMGGDNDSGGGARAGVRARTSRTIRSLVGHTRGLPRHYDTASASAESIRLRRGTTTMATASAGPLRVRENSAIVGSPMPSTASATYWTRSYAVLPVLISTWAFSTTMSLVTLLLFGRQPLSLAWKFVHVFTELLHCSYVLLLWHWNGVTVMVLTLASLTLMASLTQSCEIATAFTAIGGVLDTLNFVLCLFVTPTPTPRQQRSFRALRFAFLLHMTYIHAYLINTFVLSPYTGSRELVAGVRLYGVFANSMSVYWVGIAIDEYFHAPRPANGDAATSAVAPADAFASNALLYSAPATLRGRLDVLVYSVAPSSYQHAVLLHRSQALTARTLPTTTSTTNSARMVATVITLRRGRLVAWMLRIALVRIVLRSYADIWFVLCPLAFAAPMVLAVAAHRCTSYGRSRSSSPSSLTAESAPVAIARASSTSVSTTFSASAASATSTTRSVVVSRQRQEA